MDKGNQKVLGLLITVVVLVGIGIGGYTIYKHHQDQATVIAGQSAPPNSSSTTSPPSATPAPATTPTTPSCYTADQAASEEGQTGCVQFTGYAYTSGSGQMYLDQSTSAPYGFSAYIPAGSAFGPSLLNQYSGQSIDVTGSIVNYNGEPEIVVNSASQITLAQ